MKRALSIMFAILMVVVCFSACASEKDNGNDTSDNAAATSDKGAAAVQYTLGLGVVVDTASSKDGQAQVDATAAAVITDKDGKIVDCVIDVAQNKMSIADGVATVDQEYLTKQEKGDDYAMKGASGIEKEWFEQANFFANFVKGMTADEVAAIKTTTNDHGYTVAADEDLYAGCTIGVDDMIKAVNKACKDDMANAFTAEAAPELTLAINSEDSSSKNATAEADGVSAMYSDFAAVATVDGKIAAVCVDAIQPKIAFDVAGAIGEVNFAGTKRELKEDYAMKGASGIGKEWYEQSVVFEDYVVGKTAAEVAAIETTTNDHGYAVAADEDLYAGCTIGISDFISVVSKATGK